MFVSVFELFSIGVGPSSSHSVGPMRAANRFLRELPVESQGKVSRVLVELFGSLALTGVGHGTDLAVLVGLEGDEPETVVPEGITGRCETIRESKSLRLGGEFPITFEAGRDLLFHRREQLPCHTNGLRFSAFDSAGAEILVRDYYSVGGGFVLSAEEAESPPERSGTEVPYPFDSAADLLALSRETGLSISQLMRANELAIHTSDELQEGLDRIWEVMQACVKKGCVTQGVLPGGLGVERRAPDLYDQLRSRGESEHHDPLEVLDWLDLWAIAVNEENAAGGRVVTAPTNGAAGVIPSVLHYYMTFCRESDREGVHRFLLTSAAIAGLYKKNASISGAEVGCQGEVGVATSMAAGALTEVLGGSVEQVEEAAEIGMEHSLGLTCDPIGGLVQVPCIERNAMGAVKAVNASRISLRGDGKHHVSLDRVIRVMRRTGADMSRKYKETSLGGLAVNVSEC